MYPKRSNTRGTELNRACPTMNAFRKSFEGYDSERDFWICSPLLLKIQNLYCSGNNWQGQKTLQTPFFQNRLKKNRHRKIRKCGRFNDKYDLYSWRQGVRTSTTAEPTHEPHPHFGSINGEHIEIVPVNMNTFLRPLLLRRSEFWGRTDRTEDEQTVRSIQDQCIKTMTFAGTKRFHMNDEPLHREDEDRR